eukprot:m.2160 g.2160  ORF g.2160 m.2160 type:complete len:367 (-) comp1731_c0_seq1:278-1378(-)
MGILERIAEIESEMKRTQKNKATEYHLGQLKAKLAKLRSQLISAASETAGKGEGFEVQKSGNSRVVMIGFPSVGKSTLLNKLTTSESVAAAYEFTTLTCVPGVIEYSGAKIQLLDLPGIIEGASQGKGRGKQVIAVARTADCVLMMLDATKGEKQKELLTEELRTCGIRLNTNPPNVSFKVKKGGGVSFNATVPLTRIDERLVKTILHEYRIHNAEVLFREDCTPDEFIDVIEGNRIYMRCLYCYNKCDLITIEECDRISHLTDSIVCSSGMDLNFDFLLERIWDYLDLVRIYTKRKGNMPDFREPMIMRKNSSVKDACHALHRSLTQDFKTALVWGTSTKHNPQRVGLSHILEDEDVIQIIKKAN